MENSFIINNLFKQEEGLRLEFKSQSDIEGIAKTVTAFINGQGGDVVVGIDHDKNVNGIEDAYSQVEILKKTLIANIRPTAPISFQVIQYKRKDVILISVWEGAKKPYQYNSIIYSRKEKETIVSDSEQLWKFIQERKMSDFHWERMPALGAELSDLDDSEINKTRYLYKKYKQNAVIEDNKDFLNQTGLIQNGNITNACIVLFGLEPIRFIPQSRIRITLYPTNKTTNEFIDDRIFEGNIFRNISEIFTYFDIIYGKKYTVNNLEREERSNYPVLALREGVMNAIVHRDYNSVKGFMQISIFSDRTEISNYGGLPNGITIPKLRVEHSSILRNPDIAQMCFYRQYIEMLGSGTLRMIKDSKVNKFKEPKWKDTNNVTTVTFADISHNKKDEGIVKGLSEGISREVIDGIEGLSEGLSEGLNDVKGRYIKILLAIYGNGGIQMTDIESITDIPYKSIERYIRILRDKGIVERIGSKKTGGLYLICKFTPE